MTTHIQTILFDLDGTLLDTAPDLVHTLNQLRQKYDQPEIPFPILRPYVGLGAKALLKFALNMDDKHPQYAATLEEFLSLYQLYLTTSTQLFPQMEKVLNHLENHSIPWGIVTNRLSRFTFDLLKALHLDERAACIVCGDTLPQCKPDPAPILYACKNLNIDPTKCLYVGDAATDVAASKAAGTKSLVALYGYTANDEDPRSWQADGYIYEPIEIIDWLSQYPAKKA